jgi:hypothetical protein
MELLWITIENSRISGFQRGFVEIPVSRWGKAFSMPIHTGFY